jgi:DNA ligase-1
MQLAELVETSHRVSATPRRSEKIAALAACLRRLPPEEIGVGVAYLSGEPRQRKLGAGPATILQARADSAATAATLTLAEVDGVLELPPAARTGIGRGGAVAGSCCRARRRSSRSFWSACWSGSCARVPWKA